MAGRLYQFVKPSGAGHVCGQWVVIKYQFRDVDHTAAKNGRDDATNAATSAANSTRSASCNAAHANLIIIKHNDDYLSAYAHNDTMLVREQQEVKAGQKIATMGSTGTSSTRLHFEIRYKGKSVNPLRYLPQR